jgi:hypothetical protein
MVSPLLSLVPPRLNHPPLAFQGPPVEGTATPRAASPIFFLDVGNGQGVQVTHHLGDRS